MYTVVWATRMLDRLADLYVAAAPADRERLAVGVEGLNRRLAVNPMEEGESRAGNLRVTFVPLLVVRFRVFAATGTVRVTTVDRTRR